MVEDVQNPRLRLGRGLAALIGEAGDEKAALDRARGARRVPIELLRPNPQNPRINFGDEGLDELAASIKERGVLQPIIARQLGADADAYEIIAGERRWRAAQKAGLHEVPVLVVEADDRQSLEFAIIENVQRADLNALEEAFGYERLIASFNYVQADVAKVVGKSRSHVANTLRLLNLSDSIKDKLHKGALSAGHARALLMMDDADSVAERIVNEGLTVRDVERLAQTAPETKQASSKPKPDKDLDTKALEKALSDVIGLSVSIDHKAKGGTVSIKYATLEQLDGLCRRLRP
ncbi:MAG: ParB/RepB/Spo0J family partition protein [Beijerinckiaceae bacterium]|nr:ParB/RepB/Spo0J family partition protein [Beijerinckiaceae bacterium]